MLSGVDRHRLVEARSLALHRAIAERLRADPSLIARARCRVEQSATHPEYREAWLQLLARPLDELLEQLVADDERMRALRQTTPFTFVIGPRERWRIWREVA